jgi:mono/diheme cytochrome c family protein
MAKTLHGPQKLSTMKTVFKILKWTGIVLAVILTGLFIVGSILYNKEYDAPYPAIHASTDSIVIAHGKHLVMGTAHCVECHYQPKDSLAVVKGEEVPLAGGGFPFVFPGGKFYASNISSDQETGIGKYTDEAIARALRYGIGAKGAVLIPVMEFQNLSDEDIAAIISYLRTSPSVKYKVAANEFNLLGKFLRAFMIRPVPPNGTPPGKVVADTTVEYGRYIAQSLSGCWGCHTERNHTTGAYIGEPLAGGVFDPLPDDPTQVLVASNLTPDPQTGRMHDWTYETFRTRFQQGKLIPQSTMPWGQFRHLDEMEIKAIWNYLQSVKPVHKESYPPIQKVKK